MTFISFQKITDNSTWPRQLIKNRRIYWVCGKNLGVRAENWPEYPQIVICRSLKIVHESYVAFGRKPAKIQNGRQRIF